MEIGPCTEAGACASQHHAPDAGILPEFFKGIGEFVGEPFVDGVATVRPVQGKASDTASILEQQVRECARS